MILTKAREAFPDVKFPQIDTFYTEYMTKWADVFRGEPEWSTIKRSGLYKQGKRRMNMLCAGKILCDEFANKCFSEQTDIICDSELHRKYLENFFDREGFWKNFPLLLSYGFALGGCLLREYIEDGKVRLNFIDGRNFIPLKWDNSHITEGIFCTQISDGGMFYTHFERHTMTDIGVHTDNLLFKSPDPNALGVRVPIGELYPDMPDFADMPVNVPLFQYFRPNTANNKSSDVPLGISCFANCLDTLKALDVAFDSFSREFILGKKRIIVPSTCIRTVVDIETGNSERYFDTDDEVYQALSSEEGKEIKITDNTVELRVDEHVRSINALLNILCFQTGLSPGELSFDAVQGMKTATEVIAQNSKTAQTIRGNKNLLVEMLEDMCRAVLSLGAACGEIPHADCDGDVGIDVGIVFKDNVIVDDETLIDTNIKLVTAGLKSKLSAVMEVLKCDEETAKRELERIREENGAEISAEGENFDPSEA